MPLNISKKTPLIFAGAAFLAFAATLLIFLNSIVKEARSKIERGAIQEVIYSESPVFYDDGKTPIGVFFQKTHKKHLPFDVIPRHFIKALIAVEDAHFFDHRGIDLRSVVRATLANLKAGRVVQGGSTITQQTAKNIFRREKRSFLSKLRELIQALLLERRYKKEEILEIYINQFFVTGFGKGLEIAANYYFDKAARDLDLTEAAFIAGSVQAPNRFNPFIKKTQMEREEARRLARLRKDYVLKRMLQLGFVKEAEYREAVARDVPFREGRITYPLNVLMDYVREQLESEFFERILMEQGIDNIATSGIRIHTSVNREMQEAALRSVRIHLPLMDTRLSGLEEREATSMDPYWVREGPRRVYDALPFLARVTHLDPEGKNGAMVVAWDGGGGIIDEEGLRPLGQAWLQWKTGAGAVFGTKHLAPFLRNFQVGDVVAVTFSRPTGEEAGPQLMLAKVPSLEGAVVVLQQGMVRAMVGGFFDRFFNRAVDAKRQLGSIFKPIVFTAALQLKWNPLDPLMNVREIYRFQGTVYSPRPDHDPTSSRVSMAWAGAKSENLAAVWLLYHLTDHLNMAEFRRVAEIVGLSKRADESHESYAARIRDRYGVAMNAGALMDTAFEEAKKAVVSDVIFGGHDEALEVLEGLTYGPGTPPSDRDPAEPDESYRLEFKRLRALQTEMKEDLKTIKVLTRGGRAFHPDQPGALASALRHFYRLQGSGGSERIVFQKDRPAASDPGLLPLTPEWIRGRSSPIEEKTVLIDGLLASEVIDLLQDQFRERYRRLLREPRYGFEALAVNREFRILVNLSYVVHLARTLGVSTPLDPVLSFPLGPNAISIMEAALLYQAIMTGKRFPLYEQSGPEAVPIITKIVDREGELLWEYRPAPQQVLSPAVSGAMAEILKKVMEVGTGRNFRGSVRMSSGDPLQNFDYAVTLYGKTGTANRYTNSSFVGFVPGRSRDPGRLSLEEGYVIATYVGFDDNRPMKSNHQVIYGSSGALPVWIDTANGIVASAEYRSGLQPADIAFMAASGGALSPGLKPVPVSPASGLPRLDSTPSGSLDGPTLLAPVEPSGRGWSLRRRFEPLEGSR
jgi:membrane peptidoglycan carboxypeptidase